MAVREILKMGDERLLRVTQPVKAFNTPELQALLKDLDDTMLAANGAGLAAPQIGVVSSVCATKALMKKANRLTELWKAFMRGWCNTSATTSLASCTPCVCVIFHALVIRMCCFQA